jgi:hypothetical protein
MSIKINRIEEGHNSYPPHFISLGNLSISTLIYVIIYTYSTYFPNKIQKGKTCYSEEQVISMLEFLIDNIFVSFGGTLFHEVVSVVSLTSSSGGYSNGRHSANLELLIDKTSSIYLYVKLKALAS